jgi:uncharacterized protein YggT (Ycf19 family)
VAAGRGEKFALLHINGMMEESTMSNNSFSDEPTIEELQFKPTPQTPAPQLAAANQAQARASTMTQPGAQPVDEGGDAHNREDALTIKFAIGKLNDYLQWFLMVLETILLIRFVLKMFGADPENLFANFIFTLTQILRAPFANIIPEPSMHVNQAFEFSTIFAAAIYFLIFFALKRFLGILISNPGEHAE